MKTDKEKIADEKLNKIAKMERDLINNEKLLAPDIALALTDINTETRVLLGERYGRPAEWCPRMYELEKIYGLHENRALREAHLK